MSRESDVQAPQGLLQKAAQWAMGACLGVMALAVFVNVVLRYGFGSGLPASEELSRLLFVWMVFIGATAAYPAGEHMAFTSLVGLLRKRRAAMAGITVVIRLLVVLACALVAWGAWQQVWWAWRAARWCCSTPRPCCRCPPSSARWPSA